MVAEETILPSKPPLKLSLNRELQTKTLLELRAVERLCHRKSSIQEKAVAVQHPVVGMKGNSEVGVQPSSALPQRILGRFVQWIEYWVSPSDITLRLPIKARRHAHRIGEEPGNPRGYLVSVS